MYDGGNSGGSIGSVLGKAVAKSVSKKSSGRSVGRSASRAVSRRRSSSRRSSSSGSSGSSSRRSSRNYSSSGRRSVPNNPVARPTPAPAPAPKPVIPGVDQYLKGDSVYQQAVSGGNRSLKDYISELGRRRGESETQYKQTQQGMERDRTQQLDDLKNEFASRGLINSGLYGQEQGRFQQQFTDQANTLSQQQAALLADLLSQQTNYTRENQLAMEAAKQEALARRAAKYKIGS